MKKIFLIASAASLVLASCSDDLGKDFNTSLGIEGKSKVFATVEGDGNHSRTSVVGQGDATSVSYPYSWSTTDAIGVIGKFVPNASFACNNPSTGEFVGQLNLAANETYYGYYPYEGSTKYDGSEVTVSIPASQIYNAKAKNLGTWSWNYANGSFSNQTAPAVASAIAENADEINFDFIPVAGYIAMPVYAYQKQIVNTVQLTITNPDLVNGENTEGYVQLNGEITLDLSDVEAVTGEQGSSIVTLNPVEYVTGGLDANPNYAITVSCGAGVELGTQPVNFWFVVPSNTPLAGSTVTLVINGDNDNPVTKTYAPDWYATNPALQKVGRNMTRFVLQAKETASLYNSTNSVFITNPAQFLEYAYLATNWSTAISNYNNIAQEYEDAGFENTNVDSLLAIYSNFENMVEYTGDTPDATTAKLRPAVLLNDIALSPKAIYDWMETGNANVFSRGGIIDTPTQKPFIASYFQGAYYDYVQNGYLSPIGGKTEYKLDGAGNTLSGLKVQAGAWAQGENNGFFKGVSGATATIENLEMVNDTTWYATAPSPARYSFFNTGFSTSANYITFNGVNVGEGCKVKLPEGVDEKTTPTVLLNWIYVTQFGTVGVTSEDNDINSIAYTLYVNDNVTLDGVGDNYGLGDFYAYAIRKEGAVITIADATQANQLINVIQPELSNANGVKPTYYSVVDNATNPTSYWTGYVASVAAAEGAPYYAENLAYDNLNRNNISLTQNINLLNKPWVLVTSDSQNALEVKGNNKTISKVVINSQSPNAGTSLFNTMFGWQAGVQNLTVDSLTINNYNADGTAVNPSVNSIVAGLASYPNASFATQNVTINNLTIIAAEGTYHGVVGGMYCDGTPFSGTNPKGQFENCKVIATSESKYGTNLYGWIAGETTTAVEDGGTVTYVAPTGDIKAYGKFTIELNPTLGTETKSMKFTLEGVTGAPLKTSGLNLTFAETINAEDMEGLILQIIVDQTTYQYTYSVSKGWSDASIVTPAATKKSATKVA